MAGMKTIGTGIITLDSNGEYVFTTQVPMCGKINKILVKFITATVAKVVITDANMTDITIFDKKITKSGSIVAYEYCPVVQSCDKSGTVVSGEYDHHAVHGYLKFKMSEGTAGTTLFVEILYE